MPNVQKPKHSEMMIKLANELNGESDRALAIIAGAYLDHLLESLICEVLKLNEATEKFLFKGANAGLGTFSSKIDMTYKLGLLSKDAKNDLHHIREVRNAFAHDFIGVTFKNEEVVKLCNKLKTAKVGGTPSTTRELYKKAVVRLMIDIIIKKEEAQNVN